MTERQRFRDQIVAAFGTDELETLCRDAGVDPDLIPGKDDGKAYWADQIIAYFERRDKLPALLAALKSQRSEQVWAYTPAPDIISLEPRKLPMGLLAGGIVLAALVVIGVVAMLRGAGATPPATPTATVLPTPARAPQKMPALKTNIFVADFGQIQDGKAISIAEGELLSENLADSLRLELNDSALHSDFQPEVWSSADATANGWQIGPIIAMTDAQRIG